MLSEFKRRLRLKLFTSYLFVIFMGVIVLAISANLVIPAAFENHMSHMMAESMVVMMRDQMGTGLYDSFRDAFYEAPTQAAVTELVTAIAASVLIACRVVALIREMRDASQWDQIF